MVAAPHLRPEPAALFPPKSAPPFPPEHELSTDDSTLIGTLPGYPGLYLGDRPQLWAFLNSEIWATDLEALAPRLWWMSKPDSANISPLHRQAIKRRAFVVTEDPRLHLGWIDNRIFFKPLPRYLLSHNFWRHHLCPETHPVVAYDERRAWLARPDSSPRSQGVSWTQFSRLSSDLAAISDDDVSPRYLFGEIRLTRLNFYAPFLLGKSNHQRVEYQYASYFARSYAPLLFVIGVTSVILAALQVAVAVDQDQVKSGRAIATLGLWLSIIVMIVSCTLFFGLAILLVYKVGKE
ncbi:hypothetical protein XA68_18220 [Ophiocordyceps unilateralis]|uniref:Uncharacterized protein n=1 Tax=Ophiocordyceps unilateralis TaxID=268505 RepID=A0A2A9PRH4_OPHUN|nr:hypothetical protein XA68_18220 [Ophiocordyceps unilateralis]